MRVTVRVTIEDGFTTVFNHEECYGDRDAKMNMGALLFKVRALFENAFNVIQSSEGVKLNVVWDKEESAS